MEFSKLGIGVLEQIKQHKNYNVVKSFKDLVPKKPKINKEEVRLLEPGNKIPVSNFQQVGKWCDSCEDVEAHAHSPEKKKFRCLKCKTITYYK